MARRGLIFGVNLFMNASEWLKFAQENLKNQTWGGRQLQGDLLMPDYEWLRVTETLEIPVRQSIIGYSETVATTMPGFVVDKAFYRNEDGSLKDLSETRWMIYQKKGKQNMHNWNHPSGTKYKNFVVRCGKLVDGIWFGGAQQTTLDFVSVLRFRNKGIGVGAASHCNDLKSLYILGASMGMGQGLILDRCKVEGRSIKIHLCEKGLVANGCHDLNFIGVATEHCPKPINIHKATSNTEIHCELQTCSDTPIDLTGCGGGVHIKARIRKQYNNDSIFYINPQGEKVPLAWSQKYPKGNTGATVEITTKKEKPAGYDRYIVTSEKQNLNW